MDPETSPDFITNERGMVASGGATLCVLFLLYFSLSFAKTFKPFSFLEPFFFANPLQLPNNVKVKRKINFIAGIIKIQIPY